jgi:hypothetical protein
LAAAVLAYASVSNYLDRVYAEWFQAAPAGGIALKNLAIGILAVVIASLANIPNYLAIRRSAFDQTAVEVIEIRIRSIFFEGIDYILLNEEAKLKEVVNQIIKDLKLPQHVSYFFLFVFTEIDGLYQITASTNQQTAVQNRMRFKKGEGLAGKVYEEKTEIILNYQTNELVSYNGEQLGQQSVLSKENQVKGTKDLRWIVCRPIFASSRSTPNSDIVYGTLSVDTNHVCGDTIFFDPRFSDLLGQLSDKISPFLVAYRNLKAS